jgi:phosphohistidine phosphatase
MADEYRLFIVRHAIAEERGEAYPDDTQRPLSSKGIERFQKVVRGLKALDVSLDCVLSSPLVRARQTADLLVAGLRGRPEIVEVKALAPDGTYRELCAELAKLTRFSSIALVGHEPSIGELTARLIGSKPALEFKKGAVCCVEPDTLPPAGPGRLVWFVPPKMLASIRG